MKVPLNVRLRFWILTRLASAMQCKEFLIALDAGGVANVMGMASPEFREDICAMLMQGAPRGARRRVENERPKLTIHR